MLNKKNDKSENGLIKKVNLGKKNINFAFGRKGRILLGVLKSIFFRNIVFSSIVVVLLVLGSFETVEMAYKKTLIDKQLASLQNMAVIISSDYSYYYDLNQAQADGMKQRFDEYSSINQVRLRLIDTNFTIIQDTYSFDTDKTVINPKVISIIQNPKNLSEYNRSQGIIEVAVPVYNNDNTLVGVIIADSDVNVIDSFVTSVDNGTDSIQFIIITIGIAFVILIAYLTRRPFKATFEIVEDISLGHTDKRLPLKGCTELVNLAEDFNDIMDKASEIDKSRAEFVSNVSHELKTPITSIKVLADSLNTQEDVPVELYKEFMQDITSEIDRESKIIDDLLTLVRLDKSAATMNVSGVNLNEMMELVLKRLKPIAQRKNIELLFESFRPVVAQVDEVKLTQVISNLVENAIKYNNNDGWVHVSLNADHQYFYVRVEDSGIGIPQESQSKVFDRFYRVDKARSRETGGTGLGLAIVRNIVLMHHGTIKIHSEENVGTTFTLRIPLNYVE
ncbi:MAG: sensor histidine kinase [Lachnospira sp.]